LIEWASLREIRVIEEATSAHWHETGTLPVSTENYARNGASIRSQELLPLRNTEAKTEENQHGHGIQLR
jgi:hypothetical protein